MRKDTHCKVLTADEFRALLNDIYEEDIFVDFSADGIYVGKGEADIPPKDLRLRLAEALGVDEVTSIHIDDEEPTGVWIAFKDFDIIRRSDYIATKLWSREDVEEMLKERGYTGNDEEVDIVLATGYLKALGDCTEGDWDIIDAGIFEAAIRGNLSKERTFDMFSETLFGEGSDQAGSIKSSPDLLRKAGDSCEVVIGDTHVAKVTLLVDVPEERENVLWYGGRIVEIVTEGFENIPVYVNAVGDVDISIYKGDNVIEEMYDSNCAGGFREVAGRYYDTDRDVCEARRAFDEDLISLKPTLDVLGENMFVAKSETNVMILPSKTVSEAIECTLNNIGAFYEEEDLPERTAHHIFWDVDEEDGIVDLPDSVLIPDNVVDDDVADYLSDTYGFCVSSFLLRKSGKEA